MATRIERAAPPWSHLTTAYAQCDGCEALGPPSFASGSAPVPHGWQCLTVPPVKRGGFTRMRLVCPTCQAAGKEVPR